MVKNLVAFGGKQLLVSKTIDLGAFLRERLPRYRKIAGVNVFLDLAAEIPEVYSDSEKLEQAILSVIMNARETMEDEGELILSVIKEDLSNPLAAEAAFVQPGIYACLSVRDKGRGIPEEIEERLFEPFFSTKAMGPAAVGLGLSSAYGFIRQSGGNILVESDPDKGTAIRIYLPTVRT